MADATKKKKTKATRKPKVSPINKSLFDVQDDKSLADKLDDKDDRPRPAKRGLGHAGYPD